MRHDEGSEEYGSRREDDASEIFYDARETFDDAETAPAPGYRPRSKLSLPYLTLYSLGVLSYLPAVIAHHTGCDETSYRDGDKDARMVRAWGFISTQVGNFSANLGMLGLERVFKLTCDDKIIEATFDKVYALVESLAANSTGIVTQGYESVTQSVGEVSKNITAVSALIENIIPPSLIPDDMYEPLKKGLSTILSDLETKLQAAIEHVSISPALGAALMAIAILIVISCGALLVKSFKRQESLKRENTLAVDTGGVMQDAVAGVSRRGCLDSISSCFSSMWSSVKSGMPGQRSQYQAIGGRDEFDRDLESSVRLTDRSFGPPQGAPPDSFAHKQSYFS